MTKRRKKLPDFTDEPPPKPGQGDAFTLEFMTGIRNPTVADIDAAICRALVKDREYVKARKNLKRHLELLIDNRLQHSMEF